MEKYFCSKVSNSSSKPPMEIKTNLLRWWGRSICYTPAIKVWNWWWFSRIFKQISVTILWPDSWYWTKRTKDQKHLNLTKMSTILGPASLKILSWISSWTDSLPLKFNSWEKSSRKPDMSVWETMAILAIWTPFSRFCFSFDLSGRWLWSTKGKVRPC